MDGPHHYREAQKYLLQAGQSDAGSSGAQALIARAQVHATLAVAAATAMSGAAAGSEWQNAMASSPETETGF